MARANLIKKNLELNHLKNELESAEGQQSREMNPDSNMTHVC